MVEVELPSPIMKIPCRRISISALAVMLAGVCQASYNWGPSGLDGSGLQQSLAIQTGTGVVISAGDVSGFNRSTDYGVHWYTSNTGVTPVTAIPQPATVVSSNNPATPNTVYAGTNGGFLASTDAGQTWTLKSGTPTFKGNGGAYPRSTGHLICTDETGSTKYLYTGTFEKGIMRSTDGGSTWTVMGLVGDDIQGLVLDPNSPTDIYVADKTNHVYHCSTARTVAGTGTTGWTQLVNSPGTPQELLFIGSNLYAVGVNSGTGGIWKSSDASHTTWTRLGTGSVDTTPIWPAIAGYNNGTSDVLYIGATNPVLQS